MTLIPKVTEECGHFGGGEYPIVPAVVRILDFSIPEDCHFIDGHLYRTTYDWEELKEIVYPDGSEPTACALVRV